jgi:hypothetical protein
MEELIENRVIKSNLVSIDLESYYPQGERIEFDIKPLLYEGLMLREKDFRAFLKDHDWQQYQGKNIALVCSEDAIVPTWAYMLLVSKLEPFVNLVIYGNLEQLDQALWQKELDKIDLTEFENAKVVIKGCSKLKVPIYAYTEIMRLMLPIANSIMFGEPCSTVPLFKKPKLV